MSQDPKTSAGISKRNALPEGTFSILIGLLISGITVYLFFKIGQQALGQEKFKPLVGLWFVMFAITPGFFMPIEQEVSRAIAHRLAIGQGVQPIVKKVAILCVATVIGLLITIIALAPIINNDLFEGYGIITSSLAIAIATYSCLYLAKGICSGLGNFTAYGFIVGADGAIRVIACLFLLILGVNQLGAYSLTIAVTPIFGVLIVFGRGHLRTTQGPPAQWSEITNNLGWLLCGSIFSAALVNAGPITVALVGSSSDAMRVTQFGNAVLLTRMPLFLFQAVQAALLPKLTRLAAHGKLNEFRSGFRKLILLVVVVGIFGTIGAYAFGHTLLSFVYGGQVDRNTMMMLSIASAIYLIALANAQAVIALHGHKHFALGWAVAFGSYAVSVNLTDRDLFHRVEIALIVSSVVGLIAFWISLKMLLRAGASIDVESIAEALSERPIET